jgi:molecular chaperone HscC
LRKLKEDAERYLGEPVEEAIISVPAYFDDKQRSATKRAGELAGFKVERLINEPSAAALMTRMGMMERNCSLLVFDFGGGTLDVSLVECFENVVNVLAISGNNQLGGSDFDKAISEYFCYKNGLSYNQLKEKEKRRLLAQSENAKQRLTEDTETTLSVLINKTTYELKIDRETLVHICTDIFAKIETVIRKVMMDSGVDLEEIDEVIMVGGSSKMPVVKQYVQYLLPECNIRAEAPDTAIALGVGVYSGIKSRRNDIKDMVIMDICPFSLGVDIYNQSMQYNPLMGFIIERNTPLPCVRMERFYTVKDYQTQIEVNIYQGESRYAKENLKLAETMVKIPSRLKGEELINVTFAYDINGILIVEIEVQSTGIKTEIVLEGRGNLTEEEKAKRMDYLRNLKMPEEEPEILLLLEQGRRLYEEISGPDREQLGEIMKHFERTIKSNSILKKQTEKQQLKGYFNYLEEKKAMLPVRKFTLNWYDDKDSL